MSLSSGSLRSADSAAEPDCSPRTITSTAPRLSAGREQFEFDLNLRHAGMRRVCLRVEWTGDLSLPALWLAGGISANRHVCANSVDGAPGWWQDAMGAQRALNPQHFCLLACDWLGADGHLDRPIDSADQADAIAYVLERLGIARLHAFVGASYGGMVGQQFAIRHRHRLERLVCLSAAHRATPFASAFRALQRQVVTLGQTQCADAVGLSLARQLAMLSYRSADEFAERFDQPAEVRAGRVHCAAEDYLQHCGQRYVSQWSATAFLRLSESIDLHAVVPSQIRVPSHFLAVQGDWLAPAEWIAACAAEVSAPCTVERIESRFGHDAFLKDIDRVDALLHRALQTLSSEIAA